MVEDIDGEELLTAFIGKSDVVVVDFFASWCKPCTLMYPSFERYATEQEGEVLFGKFSADDDDWPDISDEYEITKIPTVCIFQKGVLVTRLQFSPKSGMTPDAFIEQLDLHVSKSLLATM